MRFRIAGGYIDLVPEKGTIQDISDQLKKIAEGEKKEDERKVVDSIFKPSGEIQLKRPGKKSNII